MLIKVLLLKKIPIKFKKITSLFFNEHNAIFKYKKLLNDCQIVVSLKIVYQNSKIFQKIDKNLCEKLKFSNTMENKNLDN